MVLSGGEGVSGGEGGVCGGWGWQGVGGGCGGRDMTNRKAQSFPTCRAQTRDSQVMQFVREMTQKPNHILHTSPYPHIRFRRVPKAN